MKEKRYSHDWERIDTKDYSPKELAIEVINDEELPNLQKVIIGQYTPGYDTGIEPVLEYFIEHKDKLQHIQSFYFGDMSYEECEVSWIEQGNYEKFLKSFPNIKELTIKGSIELSFGKLVHNNLEKLEIITGGLPKNVIEEITNSSLPNLKSLVLYFGIEDYGFSGDIEDIKNLINNDSFPKLKELGLVNSEIQDDIVKEILESKLLMQLNILRLSYGTLTDKGGQLLLDNIDKLKHLELLDLEYNYLSEEMADKLKKLEININVEDMQSPDSYEDDDEIYLYPMLTE